MSLTQSILHGVEEGKGRVVVRLLPLAISFLVLALLFDFSIYRGLNDPQSMDNAQLARQLARGAGFTTEVIRPAALNQLNAYANAQTAAGEKVPGLFWTENLPENAPHVVPDTYNPPAYPCLLAAWFKLTRPNFNESFSAMADRHMYAADRVIPFLNQIFLFLTAVLVFLLGRRIFDQRVAWMSLIALLLSDIVWEYSITALSTSFLIFLVTGVLFAAVELFCAGELLVEEPEAPSWPLWAWALALGLLLGIACLARLHLLALLVPVGVLLFFIPRSNPFLIALVAVIALGMVAPWFWHMNSISGSILGSNATLVRFGMDEFGGNEIYRAFQVPPEDQLFKDAAHKEWWGLGYNFAHAWELLGTSPLVLLFAVSLLHNFRRPRARAFRGLLVGSAFAVLAATNLCVAVPEAVGPWNSLVLLLPAMLVAGSAFFFILLDRLDISVPLLRNAVAVLVLALSALPLFIALVRTAGLYNYPPYAPVYIRYVAQFAKPGRWITSDMPWAMAWYGDRGSLWLPDTVRDFDDIYDDFCPSDFLILTPLTLDAPASNLISGEDKEWFPFVLGLGVPAHFPLAGHIAPPKNAPEYILWGNQVQGR